MVMMIYILWWSVCAFVTKNHNFRDERWGAKWDARLVLPAVGRLWSSAYVDDDDTIDDNADNEDADDDDIYIMIADIYISISTETFDIENIKYEKTLAIVRFRYILWTIDPGKIVLVAIIVISGKCYFEEV